MNLMYAKYIVKYISKATNKCLNGLTATNLRTKCFMIYWLSFRCQYTKQQFKFKPKIDRLYTKLSQVKYKFALRRQTECVD